MTCIPSSAAAYRIYLCLMKQFWFIFQVPLRHDTKVEPRHCGAIHSRLNQGDKLEIMGCVPIISAHFREVLVDYPEWHRKREGDQKGECYPLIGTTSGELVSG